MKKVCFLTSIDRVVSLYVIHQMRALKEEGYDVTIVSNFNSEEIKKYEPDFNVISLNINREVDIFNMLHVIKELYKLFKKNKYDLIQYTGPSTSMAASIAGFFANIKNRLYCMWGIRFEGFTGIKKKIFKLFEVITCSLSHNVLFDSPSNLKYCLSENVLNSNKADVIFNGSVNGINLNVYDYSKKISYRENIRNNYNISDKEFVIGYLGRIISDKGIVELLSAIKNLTDKYEDIKFMFVGYEEINNRVDENLMAWAKSQKQIVFCGYAEKPEEYYPAFDVFVFPSYREGYGGGVIQAAAYGIPAVVSDITPLLDSIDYGNCGIATRVKDADDLFKGLEKICLNKDLRERLGHNARERIVKDFDMSKWIFEYKRYINNLIGIGK